MVFNQLLDKMVNISAESPTGKLLETEMIKSVLAGDSITGKSVYENPIRFKPYAKHFLAMNNLPIFGDPSHGMFRRIYIIEFPRRFEKHEREAHLDKKLMRELPGIFNWSLEGYRRLKKNDFRFTEVPAMEILKRRYIEDSDGLSSFMGRFFQKAGDEKTLPLKEAFQAYQAFCFEEGHSCGSKIEFKRRLRSLGYKVENSTLHGNQVHVYGVRMKTEDKQF